MRHLKLKIIIYSLRLVHIIREKVKIMGFLSFMMILHSNFYVKPVNDTNDFKVLELGGTNERE